MKNDIQLKDLSRREKKPLVQLEKKDLMPLPFPLEDPEQGPSLTELSEQIQEKYECSLDDTCAVNVPKPETKEEEDALVAKFLSGLEKLFTKENNWTFLQPLLLSMEHCAKCQTCSGATMQTNAASSVS